MSEALVKVYRNELVESIHRGSVAVVNRNGDILYYVGDPYYVTYMRSSAKPLQAIPLVESSALEKYGINERELATIVASHSGEDIHIEAVSSILNKIGLDETYLKCGIHMPYSKETMKKLILKKEEPTPIYNNCSGKHSGMLLLAKMKNYPLEKYYEPGHPVQREILKTMKYITKCEEIKIGVDGCGVPVFGMPLYNMALGFARLTNPEDLERRKKEAAEKIVHAMQSYPENVAGTKRFDTDLMKTTRKVIGKNGAEGVYCVGVLDKGIGIALKIDDGANRAKTPAIMEILKKLNILEGKELEMLKNYHTPLSKNHQGKIVGKIVPEFDLHSFSERETI